MGGGGGGMMDEGGGGMRAVAGAREMARAARTTGPVAGWGLTREQKLT